MDSSTTHTGTGFLHDNYSIPAIQNRLQKFFIEHSRLGIPVIFTGEALHGISGLRGTIFPCPINLGATFDPELIHEVGGAIGREARSLGIQEILAPNLDVARDPRWGRMEETFGEDTYRQEINFNSRDWKASRSDSGGTIVRCYYDCMVWR